MSLGSLASAFSWGQSSVSTALQRFTPTCSSNLAAALHSCFGFSASGILGRLVPLWLALVGLLLGFLLGSVASQGRLRCACRRAADLEEVQFELEGRQISLAGRAPAADAGRGLGVHRLRRGGGTLA